MRRWRTRSTCKQWEVGKMASSESGAAFEEDAITATRVRDQNGVSYLRISSGGKIGYLPEAALDGAANPGSVASKMLGPQGLRFVSSPRRNALLRAIEKAAESSDRIKVAVHPGWLDGSTYVLGSGIAITGGEPDQSVIIAFKPRTKYAATGSHDAWVNALGPALDGQQLLQSIMCFSLAPILLKPFGQLADINGNFGLELTGKTSTGKTTSLRLAASAWGGPTEGERGFYETWRTTANGLETLLSDHCDAILPLDETNLAGNTRRERSDLLRSATFLIESGQGKKRYNDARTALARLVFLSTSNEPLSACASMDPNAASAIRVRMPTIDLSERPFGILDHAVPLGAAQTIQSINQAIGENFGHASTILIKYVTRELALNGPAMSTWVENRVKAFRRQAGYEFLSAECQRVCNSFALVFVAAMTAQRCGALPDCWAAPGRALLSTFQLAIRGFERYAGAETLEAELSAFGPKIVLFDASQSYSKAPGTFGQIRSARDDLELMVRSPEFTLLQKRHRVVMGLLRENGILVTAGAHKSVRRPINGGKPERVYVFRLAEGSCPGQIKFAPPAEPQS